MLDFNRKRLSAALARIDLLNTQKLEWQVCWEKEKEKNPSAPQPFELKGINRSLFALYEERDRVVENYPVLADEFGVRVGGGRRKKDPSRFSLSPPSRGARVSKDREARKKDIHPEFKGWCASQVPPMKFSLENWEDPQSRARFQLHLDEQETRRQREAEETRRLGDEAKRQMQEANEERQRKLSAIPDGFWKFLVFMEDIPKSSRQLLSMYEDKTWRELYERWLTESAAA